MDPDEYLVTDVIKRIGDDTISISTDYPHIDAHFPHALDEFFEIEGYQRERAGGKFFGTIARDCMTSAEMAVQRFVFHAQSRNPK